MAAFRRCLIALAVLAIFASFASAQTPTAMNCALTSFNNTIRLEGKTDQVGDITITCSGGSDLAVGSAIPQVNLTVLLSGYNITSRCTNAVVAGACTGGVSDALLLIDLPGTNNGTEPGFGPNQPALVCGGAAATPGSPTTGCSGFFKQNGTATGFPIMSSSSTAKVATAANAFQGIVNGSSVTFFGVPIMAPVSAGTSRVFTITNVRVDATTHTAGSTIQANISFQGTNVTSLLSLPQTQVNVATIQNGLDPVNTKVTAGTGPVCTSSGSATSPTSAINVATLNFVSGFGAAFKTRLVPNASQYSGVSNNTALQNVPATYATESGLTITGLSGTATTIGGLADYATRLKASFSNIPTGVRLFVSTTNLIGGLIPSTYTTAANIGSNTVTSFAQLISTSAAEGVVDGATGPVLANTAAITATAPIAAEIPLTGGAGTAIWEIFNSNATPAQTFQFNVYFVYTANVPPVGNVGSVDMSFALGSATSVPQMADITQSVKNMGTITNCRTVLMFPFVSGAAPYDTGIAISNTTLDAPVFATSNQAGACVLNFYPTLSLTPATGSTAVGTAVPAFTTPTIVAGTTYANLASVMAGQGFNGYVLAACNFQYAHGFAYVADYGNAATSSAMGYLALVVPDVGVKGTRLFEISSPNPPTETLTQ